MTTLFYSTESNRNGNCFLEPIGGIEYNPLELDIDIYPNPSNGVINFEFGDNYYDDLYINVYNSIGTLILNKIVENSFIQFKVDNNGLYFVEITKGIKKLIKKIIIIG
jgi:hypothetical protein